MAEVASAFVSLMPSAKGFGKGIAKEIGGDLDSAGKDGGKRFGGGMKSGIAGMATKIFAPLAVAAAGVFGAKAILGNGLGRLLNIEDAQAKLKGLGHDAGAVSAIMNDALASVKGTAFGLDTAATVAASAVAAGIKPGQQLEGYLKLTADAATIAGTSMGEMGSIINQVTSKGTAGMENMNRLTERGVPIMQWLQDEYGVTADEMSKMVSSGEVDAETFRRAIENNIGGAALASGDTTRGALANMGAAFSRVGANLLGGVFPMFRTVLGGITEMLGPVEEWAKRAGASLGAFATNAQGMFAPIAEAFANGGLIAAAQVAFDGLVTWLSSGGIDSIFTALISGRERLIDAAMVLFPALIDGAVTVLPLVVDALAGLIPQIAAFLLSSVPLLLAAGVQLLLALVEAVGVVVPQLAATISTLLPSLVGMILSMLPTILAAGVALFSALIDAVVTVLPGLLTALLGMLPGIVSAVLTMLPQVLTAAIELFLSLVDAVLKVLPELLDMLLGTVLPQLLSTVLSMIPQLLTTAIEVFMALLDAVMKVLPELLTLIIGTVIPQVLVTVLGMLPQLLSTAVTVFMAILTGLVKVLPQIVGFIIGTLIPTIIGAVAGAIGQMLTKGGEVLGGFLTGITDKWPAVLAWFLTLPDKIKGAISGAATWLYDAGKSIIQGLIDGVGAMVQKVKDAVGNVLSAARDLLPFSPAKEGPFSGKGWTLYSGRSISSALAEGIADNESEVAAATRSVMGAASMAGITGSSLRSNVSGVRSDGGIGGMANGFPSELVVRDVDGALIGRMQVEARGELTAAASGVRRMSRQRNGSN